MRRPARVALAAALVLAAGIAIILAAILWPRAPRPLPPLPVPNGYDDLLRAAALVEKRLPYPEKIAFEDLRAFIEAHAEPLRIAREGMRKECRAPVEFTREYLKRDDSSLLFRLNRLFALESHLHERERRPAEAVRSALDMVRLAVLSGRGAVDIMVHAELILAVSRLSACRSAMSPGQRKEATGVLRAIALWREPLEQVIERREDFERATFTLSARIHGWAIVRWNGGDLRDLVFDAETRFRLLLADLAIRVYRDDRGRWPDWLVALVPEYLEEVPLDPFTEEPLIYRPEGDGFVLYSTGPDRKDDGGPEGGGKDIFLDGREAVEEEEGG